MDNNVFISQKIYTKIYFAIDCELVNKITVADSTFKNKYGSVSFYAEYFWRQTYFVNSYDRKGHA